MNTIEKPVYRRRLPEVTFRKNRLGQFIPDTPGDLATCLAVGVELQPHTRPFELIRSVRTMIFVKFSKEHDKA